MANKIMDVAKPGATPADASSKPVIVTHRPMVADPMVNTRPATPPPAKALTQAGKKIEPLSTDLKAEPDPVPTTDVSAKPAALLEAPAEAAPTLAPEPANVTAPPIVESAPTAVSKEQPAAAAEQPALASAEQPAQQPDSEQAPSAQESKAKTDRQAAAAEEAKVARQAELQALVDSKKYYLKIDDSATSSIRTFILTVFVILLIGAIGLVVAIDAEVLDLGIDLPFNLIK